MCRWSGLAHSSCVLESACTSACTCTVPRIPLRTGRDVSGSLYGLVCTEGGWTTGHWKPYSRISAISQVWPPTLVGQSPPLAVCTKCRETQVWGFLGLRCCSQGNAGRWFFFIFFSFVLQLGGHLGFQLVYILKPLFLYPSCCTVTLNVLQMNENPPLKLLTIQCLSFFGTTFGIFNRLMARRSHQRAMHMTGY